MLGKSGYLAGTDEERAADLNRMFADPEVDAIICVRGGWGGARMLHLIDYEQIARTPKIFMGYSDVTSLLLAIHAKTGLVTFHGPVGLSNWDTFTWKHFRKATMRNRAYRLRGNEEDPADLSIGRYTIREGQAQGALLGGNLSVLSGMIGSDYLPSFDGGILLIEEVGEQVYRIDRFLTHLKLSGILDRLNGLIFGSCADCPEGEAKNKFTLREVLNDHLANWGKPAFFGTTVGHIAHQYTLPIGVQVRMDARKGTIKLLERSVI